jgi:hypothetical protein
VPSIMSLRQLAINAGAMDELDTADFEVFAHGTTAGFGAELVESQGGCLSTVGGNWAGSFHAVPNLDVASVFARRGCTKASRQNKLTILCCDIFNGLCAIVGGGAD